MNANNRIWNCSLPAGVERASGCIICRVDLLRRLGGCVRPAMVLSKCALIFGIVTLNSIAQAQEGPELSLDVSALVEDIHSTREVATDVESSLAESLQIVDQQTKALKEAGCTPETTSSQCLAMKKILREKYTVVLDSVAQRLPALKSSVSKVVSSIEGRLGRRSGATASDVQSELIAAAEDQSGSTVKPKLRLQGVSGSRLSESLGRLQKLVSTSGNSGVSMQTMQNDLYLDMRDSLRIIENLDAAIQNTRILAAVQLGEMSISDEQMSVAQEAQGFLFGEQDSTVDWLADPNMNSASESESDFKSDLEL